MQDPQAWACEKRARAVSSAAMMSEAKAAYAGRALMLLYLVDANAQRSSAHDAMLWYTLCSDALRV